MRPSPDVWFANLVLGFLSSSDSLAFGIPDDTTLSKQRMDSGKKMSVPQLTIVASEGTSKGSLRVVTVMGLLMAILRNSDADAPTDEASLGKTMTRDTAAGYLDLIESRLRNRAAFYDYLATLDDADKKGWQILKIVTLQQPKVEREKEGMREMTLACALEIHFLWAAQV